MLGAKQAALRHYLLTVLGTGRLQTMHYAYRCGQNAHHYPLPVDNAVPWQTTDTGWQLRVPLPEVPAAHIITPSLSIPGTQQSPYHCTLLSDGHMLPLQPVPTRLAEVQTASSEPTSDTTPAGCTAHIDCWHTEQVVRNAEIIVAISGTPPHADTSLLFTVTLRPLNLDVIPPQNMQIQTPKPKAISQMSARADIAARICSPTALTMALSNQGTPGLSWPQAIQECYDPQTRAYGSWPLAIRTAAGRGWLGAVEVIDTWETVEQVLQQRVPMVCSINFAAGQLNGAPLSSTPGHLVVLWGIEDEQVLVADPAAATPDEVLRRYNLNEFSRAWLQARGAGYIFAPRLCD